MVQSLDYASECSLVLQLPCLMNNLFQVTVADQLPVGVDFFAVDSYFSIFRSVGVFWLTDDVVDLFQELSNVVY